MGTKSLETELNRESVYNYVKLHPNCMVKDLVKDLGFTKSQADYYIRPMVIGGILNRTILNTSTGRMSMFTIGKKSFRRKVKTDDEKFDEILQAKMKEQLEAMPVEAQGAVRLVRLSNRHMQPPRSKRSKGSRWTGMQSSMGLFDVL